MHIHPPLARDMTGDSPWGGGGVRYSGGRIGALVEDMHHYGATLHVSFSRSMMPGLGPGRPAAAEPLA